ncbi:MAG: hypothetical protein NUV54_01800, partial [Candidatus Taylorbacteria bacterium]|nr:hypothetical protein [Candidatus Taylorbacteria bacterium]
MSISNKKEPFMLALGDIVSLFLALGIMLVIRYGGVLNERIFYLHLAPFTILFLVWLSVFFVAGLYEKHTLIFQSRVPRILIKTAFINCFLAIIFFYFIPYFGIAPKINLFIVLILSSAFIVLWRTYGYRFAYVKKRQSALILGTGAELRDLVAEVNQNERYAMRFVTILDVEKLSEEELQTAVVAKIAEEDISLVVLDLHHRKLESLVSKLYPCIFKHVRFVDIYTLYEDIFDRIPLSLITYAWFIKNVSLSRSAGYDFVKRVMDCILSFVLGTISLVLYPLIFIAIKMDDSGPV